MEDNINMEVVTKEYYSKDCDNSKETFTESGELVVPRKKNKRPFNRKYDPAYLKFGFTFIMVKSESRPQCFLCGKILANESMKPSKLQRHLHTKHGDDKNKPIEYFMLKKEEFLKSKQITVDFSLYDNKIQKTHILPVVAHVSVRAAYFVSYRIANCKMSPSIGEDLVLPCAIDVCREVLGPSAANKVQNISLSADMVCSAIGDIASDLRLQLTNHLLNDINFAIQLDETVDAKNCNILLVYVRFFWERSIFEELLFLEELSPETTSDDIFNLLNNFICVYQLSWQNCVGLSTDGSAKLTGFHSGIIQKILAKAPSVTWIHCFLQLETFVKKDLCEELNSVLDTAINIVNYIKVNAPNSKCYEIFCEEVGKEYIVLLLQTENRWLSKGKILQRLFECRDEIKSILSLKSSQLEKYLEDTDWLSKLVYVADIFSHINDLIFSMKGKYFTVFDHERKMCAFKKKLEMWKSRLETNRIDMFYCTLEFFEQYKDCSLFSIKELIIKHLNQMELKFSDYLPFKHDRFDWIETPFTVNIESLYLPTELENQLIELSCDSYFKNHLNSIPLIEFWGLVKVRYSALAEEAIAHLLPFTTATLCELGFATMTSIQLNVQNRHQIGSFLRVNLSTLTPRWDVIFGQKRDLSLLPLSS